MRPLVPSLAHGRGGSIDELLLLLAVGVAVVGVTRLADRRIQGAKRWIGMPLILLGVLIGASPFIFRLGAPRMAGVRISSSAQLSVEEPQPGAVVRGRTMLLQVQLTDARIVQKTTTSLRSDEGHLHVSLDGRLTDMTVSERQEIDIGGLGSGRHLLEVEFVAADHGPFRPRVRAVAAFTVVRE